MNSAKGAPPPPADDLQTEKEDRILRLWTPLLLRTILTVAAVVLVAGLVMMATVTPGNYVARFEQAQAGAAQRAFTSFGELFTSAAHGEPHSVLTIGLLVLTLVPLARVFFCFVLFLKERDDIFVFLTAYVLLGLIVGVMLGRIG